MTVALVFLFFTCWCFKDLLALTPLSRRPGWRSPSPCSFCFTCSDRS